MCLVSIILSILLLYPYTFAVYEQLDLFLSLYKYMSLYLLIPYTVLVSAELTLSVCMGPLSGWLCSGWLAGWLAGWAASQLGT